jgi:isochorismate hydrolase
MTDMFPDAHEHSLKYIFPRIGETDDTDRIIEKLVP